MAILEELFLFLRENNNNNKQKNNDNKKHISWILIRRASQMHF